MMKPETILRFSEWLLRFALKLLSPQLHGWDQAMLAELQSIERPLAALSWSLGCVWVILREGISSKFMELSRPLTQFKEEGLIMRDAKITAVAAVIVTFLVLTFTSFHQAIHIAAVSLFRGPDITWKESDRFTHSVTELDILRKNAEEQGNAKQLAYVAINDPRTDVAVATADRAVSLDRQWTWIYYVLAARKDVLDRSALFAKLKQWDPENAAVYFEEADQIPAPSQTTTHLNGDEPWLSAEARAFNFPKFDTYERQHFELARAFIVQRGGDPLDLYQEVSWHPLPHLLHIQAYSNYLLEAPSLTPAENIRRAKQVAAVGEQMINNDSELMILVGAALAEKGYKKLLDYPEEQVFASIRMEQIKSLRTAARPWLHDTLVANATTVQLCLIAIILSVFIMAVSFLLMLFRRRKGLRLMLLGSSAMLVTACIVGYVSYLPFAQLWSELAFMNKFMQPPENLLFAFDSFFSVHYLAVNHGGSLALYGWDCLMFALIFALLLTLLLFAAQKQQSQKIA